MDIFSHAFWAAGIFKILNLKGFKFKVWKAALWGIFPDLFTFTIPFIFGFVSMIFLGSSLPHSVFSETSLLFKFTMILYGLSHSIIIFLLVVLLLYLIFKKIYWVMFGWLIHILVDIPSHGQEWATPFLWPFSSPVLGVSWWMNRWVIALNYSLLLLVYISIIIMIGLKKR